MINYLTRNDQSKFKMQETNVLEKNVAQFQKWKEEKEHDDEKNDVLVRVQYYLPERT